MKRVASLRSRLLVLVGGGAAGAVVCSVRQHGNGIK